MEIWTKEGAVEWFRRHEGRPIAVRVRGGTFAAFGTCRGVDTVDACSMELHQSDLTLESAGADFSLSFHDDVIAAHLLLRPAGGGKPTLSMAESLPYERLILSEVGAEGKAEEPAPEKKVRSPYELLH